MGDINLNEFSICTNDNLAYAPSEGTSWNFSYLLIADENFDLSDNTQPVANHIYKCPITEISRSGSNIILASEIDEEAHLTINKIGLYIETPEGDVLFGALYNLSVLKSEDLPYELILALDTSVGVVNAVGFPAENGIIVKEPEYPSYKNFTTLKEVNTYVLTNLERIIRLNAGAKGSYENSSVINGQAGIGYNRPQVIYRVQQQLEQEEDCYNTLDTFIQLVKKFKLLEEKQADYTLFNIHGELEVPENGKVENFSTSDYVTQDTYFSDTAEWDFTSSFITNENSSGVIGALLSSAANNANEALTLYIEDGTCKLKAFSLDTISTPYSFYYYRNSASDRVVGSTTYYCWEKIGNSNSNYYNFHCKEMDTESGTFLRYSNSPIITLSTSLSNPISLNATTIPASSTEFTFSISMLLDSISLTDSLTILDTEGNYGFKLIIENGKLKAELYNKTTGQLIQGDLKSHFELRANRFYNISLSYDGEKYALHYKMQPSSSEEYGENETVYLYSDELITPYSSSHPPIIPVISGKVDLSKTSFTAGDNYWEAAVPLNTVFTTAGNPSNKGIYDNTLQVVHDSDNTYIRATYNSTTRSHSILNKSLFNIKPRTTYTVKISYSENESTGKGTYKGIMKEGNAQETQVLSQALNLTENLSSRINIPSTTYVGLSTTQTLPFVGTINLLDWEMNQGINSWKFSKNVVLNDTELIQYYRVPNLSKNQYYVKDLCNEERIIRILDNRLEGNKDIIDFNDPKGLTLCMKVDLKDAEPKVLLYKSNLAGNIYFSLTFLSQTLEFSLMTSEGTVILSKELEITEYPAYVNEPICITITMRPQFNGYGYLRMYKNNEPITDEVYAQVNQLIDPSTLILSNFIQNMPTYVSGDDIKTIEAGRYVEDIVVLKGVISEKNLKYLNNLFDTNY
jgi:hypothetical protein